MRTPDDIQDELLVMRCQDGDRQALGDLVRRWQPRLVQYAGRLVNGPDAAADVVQEAWLAIVRGLARLDDPARFRPWAYRIVTHKCADWTRRRQRSRATEASLVSDPVAPTPPQADASDEVEMIRKALRQLPNQQKAILALFYLDGMSVRLIAEILSLPEGTVKSRLFHARGHLKEVLERRTS